MSDSPQFHMAFPVSNLAATRMFYIDMLGCKPGRHTDKWMDFDFFGHQISAHLKPEELKDVNTNEVDGDSVPVRHFGVILEWDQWHDFSERVKEMGIDFLIEPHIRFKGEPGEQATMFFKDPSGNALEFKSFKDPERVFAVE